MPCTVQGSFVELCCVVTAIVVLRAGLSGASCSFLERTHMCGELRAQDEGKQVTLCGWVQPVRSVPHCCH